MIGVSRDNEYIVITIRVIGWAILGALGGAALGLSAMWLLGATAPEGADVEASWFVQVAAVLAMLLGAVAGTVLGMVLGLIDTQIIRLAAGLGVLLGSVAALLVFHLVAAHTDAGHVDQAVACFGYLLVGGVSGLMVGSVMAGLWIRRERSPNPSPPHAAARWQLMERPSSTSTSETGNSAVP